MSVRRSTGFPPKLLGRHVGGRPGASARAGEVCLAGNLRKAEVEDLYLPVIGHDQVGRLDISMRDSRIVCMFQALRQLEREITHFVDWKRPLAELLRQRLTSVVRHDDVEAAVLALTDVVNAANVGVVECRNGARLPEKTGVASVTHRFLAGEQLDGNFAAESSVFRFVDHTEATTADAATQSVGTESRSL